MENLRAAMTNSFQLYETYLPEWSGLVRPLEAKINTIEHILDECEQLKIEIDGIHYEGEKENISSQKSENVPIDKENKKQENEAIEEDDEEKEEKIKRMCAPLTLQEFNTIPKYMLGRFTLESMNEIILTIDAFLLKKHQLITKPLKTLTRQEKEQVDSWRELEMKAKKLSTGLFFVDTDIRPMLTEKLRPSFAKAIPSLRHTKRIREQRCGPITFYYT
ncbi:unnamed protein product [Caenorhabditis angaria]|uniref:SKA complex subunit 1 n=1 Tax=Caenorhabditis angaria TaxID=860376 RepID=A0A9P1MWJ3_9PELO|nr:unnamed protein product [Caenorhabditis angaria]